MNAAKRWPGAALALFLVILSAPHAPAAAQSSDTVKIAVITDMSGVYSVLAGRGSVTATQLAVDDFGGSVLGKKIEVTAIDHRNIPPKPRPKPASSSTGVVISRWTSPIPPPHSPFPQSARKNTN
jgi:hypothetical protein